MSFDGWKTYKLGDVATFSYGKMPKKELLGIGQYPTFSGYRYQFKYPEKNCNEGDLIIVARGVGGTGDVKLVREACYLTNLSIKIILNKDLVNSDFIYYNYLLKTLRHLDSGSAQSQITIDDLKRIEITLPNVIVQKNISVILKSLDEKIELNRQTNQTLEAIAQTLFKEMCLPKGDELPEGWEIGKLSEVCDVNKNTLNKKVDSITWLDYIEISEVSRGIIGNVTRYVLGEEPSRAKRKLKHGDIVLSTVRPDRGSYFLAINPAPTDIVSTGFAVFSPIKVPFSFLYLFLTDEVSLKYYGHVANGGAYPAINPNVIMNMDLIIPNKTVLNKFHEIVEPMLFQINQNEQENKILASIRDGLLPKLMSGEIKTNLT